MQLTFILEEEEQVQSIVADLLLWLLIIDVAEPQKYRLEDTLVSFTELQYAVVGNVAERPQ